MQKPSQVIHRFLAVYIVAVLLVVGFVIFKLVREEVKTSKYQARYLSAISEQLSFKLASWTEYFDTLPGVWPLRSKARLYPIAGGD